MTKIWDDEVVDLAEYRALSHCKVDSDQVLEEWNPEICLLCGENHWMIKARSSGVFGECKTPGCKGTTQIIW